MPYYLPYVCEKCNREAPYRAGWCVCGQILPRDEKHHDVFRFDVQAQEMRKKQTTMEKQYIPGTLTLAWPCIATCNTDIETAPVLEQFMIDLFVLAWPLIFLLELLSTPFSLGVLLYRICTKRSRIARMKIEYDKYIMTEAALKHYTWADEPTTHP